MNSSTKPRVLKNVAAMLLFCALVAGCKVGPNYRRPAVDAPATFRDQSPAPASANSLADFSWWSIYRDKTLQELIHTALTNNFDLRIAVARVKQARAAAMQARAQYFPAIGYQGNASRGRNALLGSPNPFGTGTTGNAFDAYLGAAWEVDLWGRIRRLNESARAQFLATEEARRGVMLGLVSDVATAYFELLELDEELAIAERSTNSFGESLRIFSHRMEGGVVSRLETSTAEAVLATSAAAVPKLRRLISLKENQISVLLGRNPGPIPRGSDSLQEMPSPDVPVGLPSALLERRPDIRQAEELVRAANAQIGVDIGDFLPRIGLSALFGGVSPNLGDITTHGASLWSVAASVSGPVFQGGTLFAQYRQAKAAWEEAKLHYQQTALNAFQEVANALADRQRLAEEREQQERAVSAYQEAVKVSRQRYVAGKASYYEVLQVQQELFPAEDALAQTRRDQLLALVQLYKALGGGWKVSDAEWATP